MLIPPDLPSPLVRRLLELDPIADADAVDGLLRSALGHGAELLAEFAATLELAHELPPDAALSLQETMMDVATAAASPELVELILRDLPRRIDDSHLDSIELAWADAPDAWAKAAVKVRADAIERDDDDVRRACSTVLSYAPIGTPGALDALLDEFALDPRDGLADLCSHGDPESAPQLLAWARALPLGDCPEDAEAHGGMTIRDDDDVAAGVYSVYRMASQSWGVALDEADWDRADTALTVVRAGLRASISELEDELEDAREALAEYRSLRPTGAPASVGTGFGHGGTGKPSRNAPCPCGSGRKAKMCCG